MCVCIVPSSSPREIYIHDMILLQLESCGLEKEVFNIWLRILEIHIETMVLVETSSCY